MQEIARLDSEPRFAPAFNGQWGIFPFPHSRTIVASDIINGLMVMKLDRSRGSDMMSSKAATAPNAAASTRSALTEYYRSRIR